VWVQSAPSRTAALGLTRPEITRIVNRYIGVSGGYLGDFSYGSHSDFYAEYCDLDLDPFDYLAEGTTRERFIAVLEHTSPQEQARIIRGVLEKYPAGSTPPVGSNAVRTEQAAADLLALAERLERRGLVAAATPTLTSEVVTRALDDAETLLQRGGPTSAVDRVHTSLHGHLRHLCQEAGITFEREDTMVVLLKKLLASQPRLQDLGPRANDIERVLRASGSILDALNPVRNNASVAHPNDDLLGREEAQLVINVSRSLLSYLDAKLMP
jgi:Abortive infection C-terminus